MPLSRQNVVAGPLSRSPARRRKTAPAGAKSGPRGASSTEGLQLLIEQLTEASRQRVGLTGVPHGTAEAFAFARLFPQLPAAWQIVYLVGSEKEQAAAVEGLNTWTSQSAKRPIIAVPPLTPALLDRLLRHEPVILVAQQQVFAESLPHPNELPQQFLTLTAGQSLSPTEIAERLAELGYGRVERVTQPAEWAKRGDVIDIWADQALAPVRLTFEGRVVSQLQTFDPESGKVGADQSEIRCAPLAFSGIDPRMSLLSYLQPLRTLIVVPRVSLLDSLPRGRDAAKHYKQLMVEPFGGEDIQKLDWRAATFYHGQWALAAKDLTKWQTQGHTIAIASARQPEVTALLKRHNVNPSKVVWLPVGTLTHGFLAPSEQYAFLTDEELFGRDARAEKNRRRVEDVFIGDLEAGDHVVHLDHGIGRFLGMRLQQVNAHTKEYFVLEYAGGDKLYVPVETADKITRYIGSPNPKIHSLSNSNWAAVTKKIQADASQIARDLLDLYAQRELAKAPTLLPHPTEEELLAEQFPYELTADQSRTLQETMADLERDAPADRLICGDVGFGKTEIAIRAAFRTVLNKQQIALLAPTTILVQQHYDTFKKRLKDLDVRIGVLSRFETKEEQREVLDRLAVGDIDIVIGTHRLLSGDVKFKSLGLIVIDEEQRFGVKHKEKLKHLRTAAHVLTLTATPIPRTLNFALAGLRDISVIETAPEGRQPIETAIMPYADEVVSDAIQRELHRHGQVYYVHNEVETIELARDRLKKLVPEATFGIAHGQMDEHRLVDVMEAFDNGRLDVLIASTIIENGLDLPNVNTLVVDAAGKFGLGQLYQLRGRVGRGDRQAYAYFLYRSEKVVGKPHKRLQALLEAKELGSGFRLAMRDLEIRGTGSILGQRQHGHVTAIGLNLYARLLAQAVEELRTGRPARQTRDILIDLPMEIAIPKDFQPSEPKRLRLYQRLAAIETVEELREFRREQFSDRTLPPPLINLLEALELKILAQLTGIKAIQQTKVNLEGVSKEKIVISFERMITPEQIGKLLERNQAWDFTPEFIKIDRDFLGASGAAGSGSAGKWLQELKQVVRIFADTPAEPAPVTPAPAQHHNLK